MSPFPHVTVAKSPTAWEARATNLYFSELWKPKLMARADLLSGEGHLLAGSSRGVRGLGGRWGPLRKGTNSIHEGCTLTSRSPPTGSASPLPHVRGAVSTYGFGET